MKRPLNRLALSLPLALMPLTSSAQDSKYNATQSPDQVENRIELDRQSKPLYESKLLAPVADWRDGLAEKMHLNLGLDYTAVYQGVSDSIGPDNASGGMVRFYGSWALLNAESANTGSLIWKVEHRHSFSNVPVSGLGLSSGYVGLFEPPFNDQGGRLTNLYWKQTLADGNATVVAGFLDVTDFVDVYLLASPWTGFNNFAFSTGSAAMDLPNEAALGAAAGMMIAENLYIQGGFTDLSSDPTEPFNSILDGMKTYKYAEFGWTPNRDTIYFQNAHVTLWHVDKRKNGTPEGWGLNLSYQTWIDDKWLPFARAGFADDSGSLLSKSISVGVGYQAVPKRDVIGLAVNWGEPNKASFGNQDNQLTTEAFWRVPLTKELVITPSLQYINNPALNPTTDNMWAFGLRARMAL
ncbi:carbohydrate porin [Coraliomargarita akajimensis]|uniref:Carbohydrate-selective porin OprB n=1 Tax=Coraliomargarita akajimensis (strain DSM 45221 / IAM 15411 / JCM 23193 / KCTC 12865 / 04OKA010-24) TaxID=583355 RepID=D5EPC3_CORAD|nr:carbohydrate porin [Coraliomargarita akajimensis]ADE55633.1 Carbohydrate-selective porin OprB [Coraliomargarita akajimensis DSM 45221]